MTKENKDVVTRLFEAFDRQDWHTARKLMAPDFKIHFALSIMSEPLDRDGFIEMHKAFDTHHELEDWVAEGNKVTVRGVMHGTVVQAFQGLQPGAKMSSIRFMDLCVVEDGKISEVWDLVDTLSFMQQVGGVPESD